jgi:hypothetical protein
VRIIVLPGERPQSWNRFNSGVHWTKRKREVDRVHMVVRAALTGDETPYTYPVDIQFVAYFDKRPLDASNLYLKPYEDALKGWLIVDDSPKYVRSVQSISLVDKDNPRMEIVIQDEVG